MDEIIKLVSDMVRFRTTADNPEEISKCADYIIDYLRGHGMVIKKYPKNNKISIVATFNNTKSPELFLNAHFDVVPASSHYFVPKVQNGKLYGRGTDDCKGQVAILMKLMRHFSSRKNPPNMGVMFTSDEEVHGHDGVEYLLAEKGYSCKFALVADGGDNFNIVTKHKGVLQLKISALGKTAHSSRYWDGVNAIEKLIKAYSKIQKLFPKLTKSEWKTSFSLSKIQGGETINKVPDYAELHLDIRRTEHITEADILKKINKIKGIQVEKIASTEMLDTDVSNPYIKKLQLSTLHVLKQKNKTSKEHGATDARYFSARSMPAALFKPPGVGAHSDNEYLIISNIKPYYEIMVDFIEKAIKKIT